MRIFHIFFALQGVTCIPLPPCPSGIDFRSETEYVPGSNCKIALEPGLDNNILDVSTQKTSIVEEPELPPCPTGIDFRSQTEYIPGTNCKILPFCSDNSNSEGIDLRSQEDEIPGINLYYSKTITWI